MKNRIHDIQDYEFLPEFLFLFDTNVWMYIHDISSPTNKRKNMSKAYSSMLQRILENRGRVVLNVIVFSEFMNTCSRFVWNARFKNKYGGFKKFRESDEFSEVAKDVAKKMREILKVTKWRDHELASNEVMHVVHEFQDGSSDVNDLLLTKECRRNSWKLVTHDGDFQFGGIDVLTANQKLLQSAR